MLLKKQFQLQGEDLCLLGDCMFFGFNKENQPNRQAALRCYEESEQLGCIKAQMALAAIYEKGLVNSEIERGGCQSFGAIQKNCAEPETDKAFEYYNDAADYESYALYKLG